MTPVFLIMGSLSFSFAEAAPGAELPQIEAALEAYDNGIRPLYSYDVLLNVKERRILREVRNLPTHADKLLAKSQVPHVRYELVPAEAEGKTFVGRQYFCAGKFRLDLLAGRNAKFSDGNRTTVWDGVQQQVYYAEQRSGRVADDAMVPGLIGDTVPPYAMLFKMAYGRFSYSSLVRDRNASITVDADGQLVIDAPPDRTIPIDLNAYGVRMFLVPEASYMPSRIEWYKKQGNEILELTHVENLLEEIQPGLWIPMRSKVTFFVVARQSPEIGKPHTELEVVVDRDHSQFNEEIDESIFHITFPVGTSVRDVVRGITYVVGKESQEATLDQLAMEARIGAEAFKAVMGDHVNGSGNRWRKVLVILNGALLALMAFGLWWKRRRCT